MGDSLTYNRINDEIVRLLMNPENGDLPKETRRDFRIDLTSWTENKYNNRLYKPLINIDRDHKHQRVISSNTADQ